jgi:hypothetical protein
MGSATPVIRAVSTAGYMKVSIEASDGNRYHADLSSFSRVYCFPHDASEWARVSIDSYGLCLTWATRFEVHIDQVLGLATRVEPIAAAKPAPSPDTHHL